MRAYRLTKLACLAVSLLVAAPSVAAWREAGPPRPWGFPADHGSHPAFRTEWWYFTGNVEDADGSPFGYQLTVFRIGVREEPAIPGNPWSVRDLYLGHLAVTDGRSGMFRFAETASRPGPGLAGANVGDLEVWILGWKIRRRADGTIRLGAENEGIGIDLTLTPGKPVVLQGEGGVSRKGPEPGQASYYTSITDLGTVGRLRSGPGRRWVPVEGVSWFDHEFGSNQLAESQAGWDWVSLHLSDGRDLMLYVLRKTDGSVEPASSGTLVAPDGSATHLPLERFELTTTSTWTSPRSGASYPARWQIRVFGTAIDLEVNPLVADQELVTGGTTGVTYWEGAVEGRGVSGDRPVTCRGYVELVGYAGALGGLF